MDVETLCNWLLEDKPRTILKKMKMSRLTWRSLLNDPQRVDPEKVTPDQASPPLGSIGWFDGAIVEFDDTMQFNLVEIIHA